MTPAALAHLRLWRFLGRLLLLAMLVTALLPMPAVIGRVPNGDKIGHALAFAGLVLWYAQLYPLRRDRWWCVVGAIGFGALIEVLQSFTTYRSAEWLDLAADSVGALFGFGVAQLGAGRILARLDRPRSARA